jgi:ATP-dependent DNA helicase RecG
MNSSGYLSDCSRSRMRANGSSSSRTWLNSDEIGEYISALSNAANLHSESKGYLVWGVEDETHRVGTTFDLALAKKGSQSLHLWLLAALRPEPAIEFSTGMVDSHRMAIVEISAATHHPVQFKGTAYIRINNHKKKLEDHPTHAKRLYKNLDETPFEVRTAAGGLTDDDTLEALNYRPYFHLQGHPVPSASSQIQVT